MKCEFLHNVALNQQLIHVSHTLYPAEIFNTYLCCINVSKGCTMRESEINPIAVILTANTMPTRYTITENDRFCATYFHSRWRKVTLMWHFVGFLTQQTCFLTSRESVFEENCSFFWLGPFCDFCWYFDELCSSVSNVLCFISALFLPQVRGCCTCEGCNRKPCECLSEQRIHSVVWHQAHSAAAPISSLWLGDNRPIWFRGHWAPR